MKTKKALGAVSTPPEVIRFMLSLFSPTKTDSLKVLEPACGDAPFLQAFQEKFGDKHALFGVEYDAETLRPPALPNFHFEQTDFLLWDDERKFDLILGNPPYGIIGDRSHYPIYTFKDMKAAYRQRSETWHGKYNIYGAFIEQAVKRLGDAGELIFVVPSTWMLLQDFKLLRKFLAESGELHVYYLGRIFPGVQVTAVVIHLKKSSCRTLRLYDEKTLWLEKNDYQGEMIRFETGETQKWEQSASQTLGELFDIFFAARSPEFKKNPFVHDHQFIGATPALTGRNLSPGKIDYETNHTNFWVKHSGAATLREFYGFAHIVIGHTKGARVVAAYDEKCYPWREEFHLVPKVNVHERQIVEYLNSEQVQVHIKTLYRDLIPHLTRLQLAMIPIPDEVASGISQV
ncbi:Eco57I restriction endonuclease [Chloroherpeton thalassium ATCC 35110]|uniref:site-specific DNA-methyltransferase (adenine-specific) n=1 Tax=Chloroherpeton thalassium (strain ATCC 35110 / GB-78) TaxID=517418 RepID=B3QU01_CHLT3|nr:TaqI-like C-terminal specificity domain-containing protein [Chloroherpeton thalassium]ACF12799.1 Eco57I restriction endonuclease [Chloroherpeton thalassium ATCC 35110]